MRSFDQLEEKIANAYQIVGAFGARISEGFVPSDADVERALDHLSGDDDFEKILPWPKAWQPIA